MRTRATGRWRVHKWSMRERRGTYHAFVLRGTTESSRVRESAERKHRVERPPYMGRGIETRKRIVDVTNGKRK